MHAYILTYLIAYLLTYLLTYLLSYLFTYHLYNVCKFSHVTYRSQGMCKSIYNMIQYLNV